jgi:hypothetical protein
MRRNCAMTSLGRKLIPTDTISKNTAAGTMNFMVLPLKHPTCPA